MADKDSLDKRGRALEEDYFRRRDQELIEKLRARKAQEDARQQMAERAGVADQDVLSDLQELGYTADSVALLHLVPFLQVAWADGSVSSAERNLIVEAARARGVAADSTASRQLDEWLTTRPSDAFFDRTLRVIAAILAGRSGEEDADSRRDLMSYASAIASASGGVLGFGKTSEAERQILARISEELERRHPKAAREAVDQRGGDS